MGKMIKSNSVLRGEMVMNGKTYDIMMFGVRLRIIDRETDHSYNAKGYNDLDEIRKAFPNAYVSEV